MNILRSFVVTSGLMVCVCVTIDKVSSGGAGLSGPSGPPPGDVEMGGPDLVTVLCQPDDHGCKGLVQKCENVLPPTSSVLPPDRKSSASI